MSDHVYYTGETNFGSSSPYDNHNLNDNGDHFPGQFGQNPTSQHTRWPRPASTKPSGGKRKRKDDRRAANRLDDPLREQGPFPMQSKESYNYGGSQGQGRSSWDTDSTNDEDNSDSPSYGIGRLFSKYADRCSMNGVPYIKTSKNYVVKFVWSCLLIIAVAAMSYHLYRLISTFLDYKKQTQVQLSFSSLEFPAVTICNVNPMRMSQRDLASDDLNTFIDNVHPSALTQRLQDWEPNYDTVDDYYEDDYDEEDEEKKKKRRKRQTTSNSVSQAASIRTGNFLDEVDVQVNDTRQWQETEDEYYEENDADSWEAESTTSAFYEVEETFREHFVWESPRTRARMGHQISDMLLQCSFAGGQCLARNFTRLLTADYGNCYTIQYPKFISRKSGPKYGLELKLFLETDEYVPGIANSKGIQVVIHDQGTLPFPDDEGVAVKAGSETRIGLKKIQISRLGKPYADCTPIEEFKRQYGVKYTRTTCQNVCQQRRTMRSCGCYDILAQETTSLIRASRNYSACENSTEIKCALRIAQQFQSDDSECGCHSPCSESSFQKIVSAREWPDSEFATLLAATVCKNNYSACGDLTSKSAENLRSEFINLVVYYEDLNFEDLEETADYEIDQFLSDVGGTVGLWIGLSILSIFEIFNLLADIILFLCCGRHKGKSSKNRYKEGREQR